MSRSGYVEDFDEGYWGFIRYRGAVASAFRGARGQAFLKEMLAALDAMPDKRLVASELEESGMVCAIGAVGRARGVKMTELDPDDYVGVAATFNIAESMAREIVYQNDEIYYRETPEERFAKMRAWVDGQILTEVPA